MEMYTRVELAGKHMSCGSTYVATLDDGEGTVKVGKLQGISRCMLTNEVFLSFYWYRDLVHHIDDHMPSVCLDSLARHTSMIGYHKLHSLEGVAVHVLRKGAEAGIRALLVKN